MNQRTVVPVLGIALIALCFVGCAPRDVVTGRAGLEPMARTELYFGLSMPDGRTVSEAEWQRFVDKHITPKFKEGLTVLDAAGQFLDSDRKVVKERTKVVILVHPDTPDARIAIFNIISAYKTQFRQESVLRVTDPVGVSF